MFTKKISANVEENALLELTDEQLTQVTGGAGLLGDVFTLAKVSDPIAGAGIGIGAGDIDSVISGGSTTGLTSKLLGGVLSKLPAGTLPAGTSLGVGGS